MKVYIMTKAKPFEKEEYVKTFLSVKSADKFIRNFAPNARKDENYNEVSYLVKIKGETMLYFLKLEIIE
jgi:hypothetical protein